MDLRRTVVRFVEIINSWPGGLLDTFRPRPDMSQHTGQCEMRAGLSETFVAHALHRSGT